MVKDVNIFMKVKAFDCYNNKFLDFNYKRIGIF